ncbi:MAG: hypothetical protein ACPGSL_02590 [Vicingaceae bacterium]
MKRKVLFVASLFLATATFAQDGLTSKKGEAYLPEAGDWSIGFNATDLTAYAGNLFNGGNNNGGLQSGGWMSGTVGQEIRFKMFKDEKTAYRLRARIGFGSSSSDQVGLTYDHDADATTENQDYIINTKTSDGFSLVLGAGLEKRRGNTRIQGYYGGEVFFGMLGGGTTKTDDGSVLNDNYNGGFTTEGTARTTEVKNGNTMLVGLQGFIGVEWFFAPKVSLGAEYTWGLSFRNNGESETTKEYWGTTFGSTADDSLIEFTDATNGANGSFSLDTGHNAMLNLQFHF